AGSLRMLARNLRLAVPRAARGDRRGDTLIDAADVDGDGGAEARADHADAVALDVRILGEEGQRVARRLHLLEADQIAARAFALAAARPVDAKRDVANLLEHLAGFEHVGRTRVAAEAVHDDEGRAAFARLHAVRHADGAGELECTRLKRNLGLGHALDPPRPRPRRF